jgi:hypothetical protein
MSITHEQAHRLIQLNMDGGLSAQETATLSAHLHSCHECSAFAREIRDVAELLPAIMKRQWSAQPTPLSIPVLLGRKEVSSRASTLLTMRTALISLAVMAVFFSTWQFVLSGPTSSPRLPLQVPPIPTPSSQRAQSTSTKSTLFECEMILYPVGETDSIASIAIQFSLSPETIMELNHLQTEAISPSMELLLPVCKFTPTGTFHAATFTTTYTPRMMATTSTPVERH